MPVGYVFDAIYLEHDTGDHPESARRLGAIIRHLANTKLLDELTRIPAERATREDLLRIHAPEHIDHIASLAEQDQAYIGLDTIMSPKSYEAALFAAGGTIAATRAVLQGDVESAFALVRPPGHHAVYDSAMGFCLFNNIAIAAAWALEQPGIERVAIVDFDVHHGNGVQEAFGCDPQVLYVSTHQHPFYPGTGMWEETGADEGTGTLLNISLPEGTGDRGYRQVWTRLIEPKVRAFQPQIILASAGYDAHWADPLAWMQLSMEGYHEIATRLVRLARELCDGKLMLTLEGGYELLVLAHGVASMFSAMLDLPFQDLFGPSEDPETNVETLVAQIAQLHNLA